MKGYKFDSYPKRSRRHVLRWLFMVGLVLVAGFLVYKFVMPSKVEKSVSRLQFDSSVTEAEKQKIIQAVNDQQVEFKSDVVVSVANATEHTSGQALEAYVPVTDFYSTKQSVASDELKTQIEGLPTSAGSAETIMENQVVLLPASQLTNTVKLLALDGEYYLDTFTKGAVFRVAEFKGANGQAIKDVSIKLNDLPGKDQVLKVNMTGVTALTRVMMRKLDSVRDPEYFSAKIGDFLADADITHVSNEVSFRDGCQYSNTSFCSPKEFIETLKASGVNLVEITGNHNNDNGSAYNTDTINLYKSLGWGVFGGGLNATEATKPYTTSQKGNRIAFIGYNMADGPGSGAIATSDSAGANIYEESKAKKDIETAKNNGQFVIVNIQYAECQAYPSGYVEFPQCDGPIGGQQEAFRRMIDFGADMVIGSSAHQPQTYELYNSKPIYYGLGNLYFEQYQWPGTERGIILTHYFAGGKLLQTKLSPTVYDRDLQTRLMTASEAEYLLNRLKAAR